MWTMYLFEEASKQSCVGKKLFDSRQRSDEHVHKWKGLEKKNLLLDHLVDLVRETSLT